MKQFRLKKSAALLLSAALMLAALSACGSGATPTRGSWEGNEYTNEFLNLHFTLPDDWVASTDTELSALMGETDGGDLFTDYDAVLKDRQTIVEMGATDPETLASVNICYENLRLSNNTKMTPTEYLETSIEMARDQYEGMGLTAELGEIEEVEWMGNSWQKLTVVYSMDELFVEQCFYARKMDDYMSYIIFTAFNESTVEMQGYFS